MKNNAQFIVLSLLTLIVASGAALADFRPGRVRGGIVSEMHTVVADGIFEKQKGAQVEMNYEDGKFEPVSITLKIEGAKPMIFPITKLAPSNCGKKIVANDASLHRFQGLRLELVDYTDAKCRMAVGNKWHLTLIHQVEKSTPLREAKWKLEGQPVFLAGTRSTAH